jgi:hypothetical protein
MPAQNAFANVPCSLNFMINLFCRPTEPTATAVNLYSAPALSLLRIHLRRGRRTLRQSPLVARTALWRGNSSPIPRNPGVSPVVNMRFAVPEREGQSVAVLAFGNPVTERAIVSSPWACHVELAPPFWCASRKCRAPGSAILSQQLSTRAAIPISMSR